MRAGLCQAVRSHRQQVRTLPFSLLEYALAWEEKTSPIKQYKYAWHSHGLFLRGWAVQYTYVICPQATCRFRVRFPVTRTDSDVIAEDEFKFACVCRVLVLHTSAIQGLGKIAKAKSENNGWFKQIHLEDGRIPGSHILNFTLTVRSCNVNSCAINQRHLRIFIFKNPPSIF